MKLTKKLTAIAACAVMATSSMVGMSASAEEITNPYDIYHPSDFLQYSSVYTGEYSKLYAQVYAGTLSSINNNYDGSWKIIAYYTYTDEGGKYVLQDYGSDIGTETTVSCSIAIHQINTCQ